jgi:YidC/Oxa1 family membrane protein insertase
VLSVLGLLWNDILINPMVNVTIALARVLFDNFGLSIIVFTLLMRAVTLPLTLRQVHSQKKMQQLQPQLNDLQKRVKDPKKRSEETMKLYKEAGANPAGCLLPMLIQFPIWIALYDVIRIVVGGTPESLLDLSSRLYPWSFIQQAVPLSTHFLVWDMGQPDKTYILPILVAASMWVQQKLTMTQASMTAGSQSQQQTNQMMLWMMPLMFGYFTINVPTGLGIYWLITNLAGIVMNYYVFGWKGTSLVDIFLKPAGGGSSGPAGGRGAAAARPARQERSQPVQVDAPNAEGTDTPQRERPRAERRGANGRNGRGGNKRKDSRGGNRPSPESPRP